MNYRGYLAVRLTDLRAHGLFDAYFELYETIAARLQSLPDFTLHAPHRVSSPETATPDNLTATDVYLLDRLHVTHSDVLIACLELPSFGVGAEIQVANDHGIPIVAFYYKQATRGPSRLMLGMPSLVEGPAGQPHLTQYFPSPEGRAGLVEDLATAVGEALAASAVVRRPSLNIARRLEVRRQELGLECEDLARIASVTVGCARFLTMAGPGLAAWLSQSHVQRAATIPAAEVDEDLVLLPSLTATIRLARALKFEPEALLGSGLR